MTAEELLASAEHRGLRLIRFLWYSAGDQAFEQQGHFEKY
jgi:hypothetical protein